LKEEWLLIKISTALYVLEPWEVVLYASFLFVLFAATIYAVALLTHYMWRYAFGKEVNVRSATSH
jgi:hypothetical protein